MRWQAAEGVYTEEIDGETILLDSAGNRYLTLNETASAIWREVIAGHSVEQVSAKLCEEWDISPADASRSAQTLIDKLVDAGILVAT